MNYNMVSGLRYDVYVVDSEGKSLVGQLELMDKWLFKSNGYHLDKYTMRRIYNKMDKLERASSRKKQD